MRIFALSDIHVDYESNAKWVDSLSKADYVDDVLILAGDITHRERLLVACLDACVARFRKVLFVPGNHDLWVVGEDKQKTSLQKYHEVVETVVSCGASMEAFRERDMLIVPLHGWYDYSFGEPSEYLKTMWSDFVACRWPEGFEPPQVAAHFDAMNRQPLNHGAGRVITFSHFLPRIDLIPSYVPQKHRQLDPVLGSVRLERRLRSLNPEIHVYGHSHINRSVSIDGVNYINNAFGYPQEEWISMKRLLCIAEV